MRKLTKDQMKEKVESNIKLFTFFSIAFLVSVIIGIVHGLVKGLYDPLTVDIVFGNPYINLTILGNFIVSYVFLLRSLIYSISSNLDKH